MEKRIYHKTLFAWAMVLLVLFSLVFTTGATASTTAFAESSEYSSVMDDLKKDETFIESDFRANAKDGSLQVIQIAESTGKELFIYVFQPSALVLELTAKQISMSLTESVDGTKLYGLTLLSRSGFFSKYKVNDFTVSEDETRYYNITSIYRPYNKIFDDSSLSGYSSIAFEVGQFWTATTEGDSVAYTSESIDVITITDCVYGSIRVPEGFDWIWSTACDVHILAFSTDISMDKLIEADVTFKWRSVGEGIYDKDYSSWYTKTVPVNYEEYGSSHGNIFGGKNSKTWDKIQTSKQFLDYLSKNKIKTEEGISTRIAQQQWVLAFYETDYQNGYGGVFGWLGFLGSLFGDNHAFYTEVSEATILRLEFIKDNVTYNLGAVSNSTGSFDKIGGDDYTFWDWLKEKVKDTPWWVWLIVAVVVVIVAIVLLCWLAPALVKTALSIIGKVFKAIGKALWWLICLPFKGIAALVRKIRGE